MSETNVSKDELRQSIKEFLAMLRELRITNPQRAGAYLIRLVDALEPQEAA